MENFGESYIEDEAELNGAAGLDCEVELEDAEELEHMKYEEEAGSGIYKAVRVTKKEAVLHELFRKYKQGKLILDVTSIRWAGWSEKQKCELIESMLMGLPLPVFYFKQLDHAGYVVVDGQQRLSALFGYLNNEFALKDLNILDFLNGKKFKDLKDGLGVYQSQLEDYQICLHVILPSTPDKILFDILDRVNRGGTRLNKQEIRNALYQGKGMEMICGITKGESFRKAARIESEKDTRMKGAYLLTRFCTFYLFLTGKLTVGENPCQYQRDCDRFIEISLKYLNSCAVEELSELKRKIEHALENAYFYLGRLAFRKTESDPVNVNLFETTLFLMIHITPQKEEIRGVLKDKLYDIINSKEFSLYSGSERDQAKNVMGRFGMICSLVREMER